MENYISRILKFYKNSLGVEEWLLRVMLKITNWFLKGESI